MGRLWLFLHVILRLVLCWLRKVLLRCGFGLGGALVVVPLGASPGAAPVMRVASPYVNMAGCGIFS